jgi:uncharacterized protein (TIRG00374 family)
MKINKWVVAALGIAISAVFLYFAFGKLQLAEVFSHIRQANFAWLALAAGVFFISTALIALRWQYLLRSIQPVPLGYLMQLVMIGYAGNNVYPFRTGEILRIVLLQRQHRVPIAKSTTTVVVERVFDGLVMLTFIVVSLALLHITSPHIQTMIRVAAPLFLALVIAFLALAARPNLLRRRLRSAERFLPGRLSRIADHIGEGILHGLEGLRSPADLAGAVFSSFATWGVQAALYWMVAFAFNLNVSLAAMFLVVGVVNLAGLVPASPGQVGVFEFFTGLVLGAVGVGETQAHAYALVAHVVIWLPVTALGFYYLARHGLGWGAITHAGELERSAAR